MRGDDRDDAPRTEDEPFTLRLLDGVRRFFLDFGSVRVNERILSHASANDAGIGLLRFFQRRGCFAVVPVSDWKVEIGK